MPSVTQRRNHTFWPLFRKATITQAEIAFRKEKIEEAKETQKDLTNIILEYEEYLSILKAIEEQRPLGEDEKRSKQILIETLEKLKDPIENKHLDELIEQRGAELTQLQGSVL
ncbi:MAG: hypothetical protein AMJ43_05725 [Coxiella sp. DG_40]|nr:MAG: hypothetical protein AMJ43_05725 [Coxiella sp. DG_40]